MFNLNNSRLTAFFIVSLAAINVNCLAEHTHTSIGINQDKIVGTEDDNKLWFSSMPGTEGWPDWGNPLEMVPTGNYRIDGKQDYVCDILYCWHAALPEDGSWQLPGSSDQTVLPQWQISLERVSFDNNFFMLDGRIPVLTSDGSSYSFADDIEWEDDEYNNNGQLGSWAFEHHLYFHVWADDAGEVFNATFRAIDTGITNLAASDDYTISFVTVPEPTTILFLAMGLIGLGKKALKRF
ncbi:MAG TPA: PEP-CTERM sorting domain-containing protein [Sedimentisphaerales bacterium]|nr:PEP-CTERM sorting domain-containing protein [Sedimentisphaerales bacterium]